MSNLIDFFETLTGLSLDWDNPALQALACISGFIIIYDVIHLTIGSICGFTYKFK